MAFVDYHIHQEPLPTTLWDGTKVITQSSKVRILLHQRDESTWYIIEPSIRDSGNRIIVLNSAASALFSARLYQDTSAGPVTYQQVVNDLLTNGIPFNTCISHLRLEIPAPTPDSVQNQKKHKPNVYPVNDHAWRPWHPLGWTATLHDFDLYEQRRDSFLSLRHIRRAALMHGGIVWRLALGDTDWFNTVSAGSMKYATRPECCFRIPGFEESQELVDDGLSQKELNDIVGAYVIQVKPGDSPQCKIVSWWPRPAEWKASAMYSEIWTAENEKWFQRHLAKLKTRQVQPQKWESLPGIRQIKKVREGNNHAAASVISACVFFLTRSIFQKLIFL
jgi:hypothetical protein